MAGKTLSNEMKLTSQTMASNGAGNMAAVSDLASVDSRETTLGLSLSEPWS